MAFGWCLARARSTIGLLGRFAVAGFDYSQKAASEVAAEEVAVVVNEDDGDKGDDEVRLDMMDWWVEAKAQTFYNNGVCPRSFGSIARKRWSF